MLSVSFGLFEFEVGLEFGLFEGAFALNLRILYLKKGD
jgi:hypothetical protein